ncbi:alpha/beta hydrolase [Cupriavidus basilensis]
MAASRNDPSQSTTARADGERLGQPGLVDLGEVGHLNPAAGFGPWPGAHGPDRTAASHELSQRRIEEQAGGRSSGRVPAARNVVTSRTNFDGNTRTITKGKEGDP